MAAPPCVWAGASSITYWQYRYEPVLVNVIMVNGRRFSLLLRYQYAARTSSSWFVQILLTGALHWATWGLGRGSIYRMDASSAAVVNKADDSRHYAYMR